MSENYVLTGHYDTEDLKVGVMLGVWKPLNPDQVIFLAPKVSLKESSKESSKVSSKEGLKERQERLQKSAQERAQERAHENSQKLL